MSRIHILPDRLVSQIAAGEVVERPASVVKELIENSLDAAATAIDLDLENGGKRRIRVRDDGRGMDRDDALLAFDRHATSKIESFDDLEAVTTLGFRGEALASVAAVAKVDLTTATEAGEGFRVRIEGGRVRKAEPVAAPAGTTIEVASLFYNVPARRSFLKSPRTELQRSTEVIQAYALAQPEVAWAARHNGRLVFDTPAGEPGIPGLERRLNDLFRRSFVADLKPMYSEIGEGSTVWGFIGTPATGRSRRRFTFINRRLVRDRAIMATFYRAVRDEWRSEEFPALFLFLDLPGAELDVNVHPQKAEVRFRDPRVLSRLYDALRSALGDARGEVGVSLTSSEGLPGAPLAWKGRMSPSSEPYVYPGSTGHRPVQGASVGEGPPSLDPRLPEVSYSPLPARPVPLSGRSGLERSFRLLGQYKGTVLLLEGPDGLYLIDQHVAHERILYERIRTNLMSDRPEVQRLLEPILLELSPPELLRIEPLLEELDGCGIQATTLSGSSLAVTGIPTDLSVDQVDSILRALAQKDKEAGGSGDLRRLLVEEAAASMSCRAAVKMHDPLDAQEMERLVSELFEAEQPYACPHGRPVILKITDQELETSYKRR